MEMDDLMAELLPIYIGELHEHVKLIGSEMLALEKEGTGPKSAELLESLFRTIHSLKGASRSVGLGTTASVCHEMESIFAAMQGGAKLDGNGYQLMFKALDLIENTGQLLQTGDSNAERPLAPTLFLLKDLFSKIAPPDFTTTSGYAPIPAPPNFPAPAPAVEPTPPPAISPVPISPVTESPAAAPPALTSPPPAPSLQPQAQSETPPAQPSEPSLAPAESAVLGDPNIVTTPDASPWVKAVENSVRLPVAKLDNLLAESSDLITVTNRNLACLSSVDKLHGKVVRWQRQARHESTEPGSEYDRLQTVGKELEQIKYSLLNENRHLKGAVSTVAESVRGLRMVPIGRACQGIDRMVRDLASAGAKQIGIKYSGMELEVDRNVLEQLRDPLMHLVRNACDHGIESCADRIKNGKSETATITVEASVQGNLALIKVSDDGRGIDTAKVRARAEKLGHPIPENDSEINHLLFSKGFSTAPIITEISGRGVGLDVVKDKIERLHGSVELTSVPGEGTTFYLHVPLSLTNMRVLFVKVAGMQFALPTTSVQKLVRFSLADLKAMDGRTVLSLGESPIPVVTLNQILDLPASRSSETKIPGVVLSLSDSRAIIVVDELLSEQEVLVKNLGDRIKKVKHIAASTILPSGQIALIVNASELLRSAFSPAQETMQAGSDLPLKAGNEKRRKLLLVDDSITTRSLEKHLLESAGFDVTACVDGAQAWQTLQEKTFDLIVSDVEMPRMDGFALTTRIKTSPKHMRIPVILVTALASEKHKAQGIASGADAYLVKSEVERSALLEVINQLI